MAQQLSAAQKAQKKWQEEHKKTPATKTGNSSSTRGLSPAQKAQKTYQENKKTTKSFSSGTRGLSSSQKAQKAYQEKNKKTVKGNTYDAKQVMSDRTYERIRQHETGEKPFSSEAEYRRVKAMYNRRLNARG